MVAHVITKAQTPPPLKLSPSNGFLRSQKYQNSGSELYALAFLIVECRIVVW